MGRDRAVKQKEATEGAVGIQWPFAELHGALPVIHAPLHAVERVATERRSLAAKAGIVLAALELKSAFFRRRRIRDKGHLNAGAGASIQGIKTRLPLGTEVADAEFAAADVHGVATLLLTFYVWIGYSSDGGNNGGQQDECEDGLRGEAR